MAIESPELGSIREGTSEIPVLSTFRGGARRLRDLDRGFVGDAMRVVVEDRYRGLSADFATADSRGMPAAVGLPAPPYRHPPKILGIGLNFAAHARDLSAPIPDEPASFLRADHTIVGPEDAILLPWQSRRVTSEAELGLVIGRYCRNVSEQEALRYVFGVCPILDQTAEDILRRNPRFLTRAKNFPTFFSFGPTIIPMAKVLAKYPALDDIEVSTVLNGEVVHGNVLGNMIFPLAKLISFHSHVMPLFPGDIISTGTPGAVPIVDGDVVECQLGELATLRNPVREEPMAAAAASKSCAKSEEDPSELSR